MVQCTSSLDPRRGYDVTYDYLVIGVGADCNHYNIPGVREHAFFLKVCVAVCVHTWFSFVWSGLHYGIIHTCIIFLKPRS